MHLATLKSITQYKFIYLKDIYIYIILAQEFVALDARIW